MSNYLYRPDLPIMSDNKINLSQSLRLLFCSLSEVVTSVATSLREVHRHTAQSSHSQPAIGADHAT